LACRRGRETLHRKEKPLTISGTRPGGPHPPLPHPLHHLHPMSAHPCTVEGWGRAAQYAHPHSYATAARSRRWAHPDQNFTPHTHAPNPRQTTHLLSRADAPMDLLQHATAHHLEKQQACPGIQHLLTGGAVVTARVSRLPVGAVLQPVEVDHTSIPVLVRPAVLHTTIRVTRSQGEGLLTGTPEDDMGMESVRKWGCGGRTAMCFMTL
jgi:hypothetical protein